MRQISLIYTHLSSLFEMKDENVLCAGCKCVYDYSNTSHISSTIYPPWLQEIQDRVMQGIPTRAHPHFLARFHVINFCLSFPLALCLLTLLYNDVCLFSMWHSCLSRPQQLQFELLS